VFFRSATRNFFFFFFCDTVTEALLSMSARNSATLLVGRKSEARNQKQIPNPNYQNVWYAEL
jgi:hypothetical protein